MYNLSICRICLASEVQMHVIENTEFHMTYENICKNKLQTEDGRPTQVCYLCYTQLRKCHELMINAVKSDEILTPILNTGIELTESSIKSIDRQQYKLTDKLDISCMEFTNVSEHNIQQDVIIKEEVFIKEEVVIEEVVIKQEGADDYKIDNINLTEDKNKSSKTNVFEVSTTEQQQKEVSQKVKIMDYLNSPYKCEKCRKGFHDLKVYEKHVKNHEKDKKKPYSCKFCNYKCSWKGQLQEHLRTHTGEKPYSCTLCEYKCATNGGLKAHTRKHTGEKPLSCTLCQYKSSHSGHLKIHMRSHTGEKPYSCTLCEYKCSLIEVLKIHMRTHTTDKPYSCAWCEYKGSSSRYLKFHMMTHTGEKPFACTLCEYKCTKNDHLKNHMRTHTGEKPYSCALCDYKCSNKRRLKVHMGTHTGEKPYSCTLCEFKCSNSGRFKVHMTTHIGIKQI